MYFETKEASLKPDKTERNSFQYSFFKVDSQFNSKGLLFSNEGGLKILCDFAC